MDAAPHSVPSPSNSGDGPAPSLHASTACVYALRYLRSRGTAQELFCMTLATPFQPEHQARVVYTTNPYARAVVDARCAFDFEADPNAKVIPGTSIESAEDIVQASHSLIFSLQCSLPLQLPVLSGAAKLEGYNSAVICAHRIDHFVGDQGDVLLELSAPASEHGEGSRISTPDMFSLQEWKSVVHMEKSIQDWFTMLVFMCLPIFLAQYPL